MKTPSRFRKGGLFAYFLIIGISLVLAGCVQTRTQYVCPDSRIVDNPNLCFTPTPLPSVLASATPLPEPTLSVTTPKPPIEPPSSESMGVLERAILEEANGARKPASLEPLVWNERAASAARKYAKLLVEEERFAHTGSLGDNVHDRLRAEGVYEFVANENLAQFPFNGTVPSAKAVVDGWLKSPGHRSNIIDVDRLYDQAGVGAYCGSEYCVFAFTAVALSRTSSVSLEQNVFTFIYLNDPGYGFGRTLRMRFEITGSNQDLDVFLLPDYAAFETAKSLTARDFQDRRFPFIQRYDDVRSTQDAVNASVGMGVMVINSGTGVASFQFRGSVEEN